MRTNARMGATAVLICPSGGATDCRARRRDSTVSMVSRETESLEGEISARRSHQDPRAKGSEKFKNFERWLDEHTLRVVLLDDDHGRAAGSQAAQARGSRGQDGRRTAAPGRQAREDAQPSSRRTDPGFFRAHRRGRVRGTDALALRVRRQRRRAVPPRSHRGRHGRRGGLRARVHPPGLPRRRDRLRIQGPRDQDLHVREPLQDARGDLLRREGQERAQSRGRHHGDAQGTPRRRHLHRPRRVHRDAPEGRRRARPGGRRRRRVDVEDDGRRRYRVRRHRARVQALRPRDIPVARAVRADDPVLHRRRLRGGQRGYQVAPLRRHQNPSG